MKPLIIIPTYNEAQNIKLLIPEIFYSLRNVDFALLFVDDSSQDGTIDEIKKFNKDNIFIIKRKNKLGLASAYVEGFRFGLKHDFDCFIEFDADFSHNPKYLPQMLSLLEFNDLVIGSRNIEGGKVVGWSMFRNLISKGGSLYSRFVLKCPIHDLTGGFNGWRKDLIQKIDLDNLISKGYCFQIEMKYRAFLKNSRIKEFPIIFEDRKYGFSKMDKEIFFEALINILKLRFSLVKK